MGVATAQKPVSIIAKELASRKVMAQLELEYPLQKIASDAAVDSKKTRRELERTLLAITNRPPVKIEDQGLRKEIVNTICSRLLGFGYIDELLADPEITEVMVNGSRSIYYERAGKLKAFHSHYENDEQVRSLIDRIIAPLGRRVDESSPLVSGRLRQGHRVHAIIPPLAIDGPSLTIRKFREKVFSLDELSEKGSFPAKLAIFFKWMVLLKKNIAVSGGTGSGKTTFLNALSLAIPYSERIITIEDSAELKFNRHPHVVRLESRNASVEGLGEVSIRDLVITSLRMRPDRIVVGEVRGSESLEMLQAMNTGHDGSMTTLHANSAAEVVSRLITMVGYGAQLSEKQVVAQIVSAFQIIIHLERLADGTRIVKTVSLLERAKEKDFQLIPILTHIRNNSKSPHDTWRLNVPDALLSEISREGIASQEEIKQWIAH